MRKTTKLTNEIFIKRARDIHGDKYNYSKVSYKNFKTKVIIICPIHGEFEQRPDHHLNKVGCKQCGFKNGSNKHRYTLEQFINKARKIHGIKYDYSRVNYTSNNTKVIIICPEHGEFEQTPGSHTNGSGCPQCSREATTKAISHTKESFVEKAKEIHGDKYDYSKVDYKNLDSRIIIICPKHGEFIQKASQHLRGNKCRKCSIENRSHNKNKFIERARKIHGYKYNYSKVICNNLKDKVIIICPEHGEFVQKAQHHINKRSNGCPECGLRRKSLRLTKDQFIEKSKEVHKDKYDYSKINYISLMNNVSILCPEHGEFLQRAGHHIGGSGCPSCPAIISSDHQEIMDYIKSISDTEIKTNDRQAISPYELDIYLPEYNFAIEHHGLYWHSYGQQESPSDKKKHQHKHQLCVDNNIKLYQILENEWFHPSTKEILKSKIKLSLGMGNKIYARKCSVRELDNNEYREFMSKYHMQGNRSASVRIGLFYQDELISVMSFNKHPKYEWEITRFASKTDTIIVGGASKLFKYFNVNYNPGQILTYADRRYSDGNLYRKLGFKFDGFTDPNYFYMRNGEIFSRQQFQKHKLRDKLEDFDQTLSESANMFNNGYRRMWDAGHYRFLWR